MSDPSQPPAGARRQRWATATIRPAAAAGRALAPFVLFVAAWALLVAGTRWPEDVLPSPLAVGRAFGDVIAKGDVIGDGASTDDYNSGKAAIGTGPYRLVRYTTSERVELVRNEDWWGDKPAWERVTIRGIPNAASRVRTPYRCKSTPAIAWRCSVLDSCGCSRSRTRDQRPAAVGGPSRRPSGGGQPAADHPARRRAVPDRPAARLPVPPPLPQGTAALRRAGSGTGTEGR